MQWLDRDEDGSKKHTKATYSQCIQRAIVSSDARTLSASVAIYIDDNNDNIQNDVRLVARQHNGAVCQWRVTFRDSSFGNVVGLQYLSRSAIKNSSDSLFRFSGADCSVTVKCEKIRFLSKNFWVFFRES